MSGNQRERCARVLAAFFAAWLRPAAPLVLTALFAAALRAVLVRWRADIFACFESALRDAAERPMRFSALVVARERFAEVLFLVEERPLRESLAAFLRVAADVAPFLGDGNFTPARRAFDRPIAMACFVFAVPCLPSRI